MKFRLSLFSYFLPPRREASLFNSPGLNSRAIFFKHLAILSRRALANKRGSWGSYGAIRLAGIRPPWLGVKAGGTAGLGANDSRLA
jgi:hypothetical protein